jgi:hypothetical protein
MTISSESKKNNIDILIRTCRLLARMNRARPEVRKSQVKYYQMLATYYTRLAQAREEGLRHGHCPHAYRDEHLDDGTVPE